MGCYLSTSCFRNTYVAEAIELCAQISGGFVEISAPHKFQTTSELATVLKAARDDGVSLCLHNYFPAPERPFVLNMASDDPETKKNTTMLMSQALELALVGNSPLYGVHAGYLGKASAQDDGMFSFSMSGSNYSQALDNSVSFLNSIAPRFEEAGVRLLVENLFPSINANNSLCCSLEQIHDLIDQVHPSVGLLLDLGHMNIACNLMDLDRSAFLESFLNDFSDRLFEVHISDNCGLRDEHLAIKQESWQLSALTIISEIPPATESEERIYCLEARNATIEELSDSLDLVNNILQ